MAWLYTVNMNERVPIGIGSEKRIFVHASDPSRVEGVYRERMSDADIKSVYYYNKLLHILFPDNTMDIYKAGNAKNEEASSFVADRAALDEEASVFAQLGVDAELRMATEGKFTNEFEQRLSRAEDRGEELMNDERIINLHEKFAGAGVPLDWNHRNFTFDERGEAIFLDVQRPFEDEFNYERRLRFDPDKLEAAIALLPDQEREVAVGCFKRLMELYESLPRRDKKINAIG